MKIYIFFQKIRFFFDSFEFFSNVKEEIRVFLKKKSDFRFIITPFISI